MSTKLFDKLVALAGCVETELEAVGVTTCSIKVTASQTVDLSADMEEGDTAWVALNQTLPAVLLEEGQSTKCATVWQHIITIGHVTCYPITEDPLSDAEMLRLTDKQLAVMNALRKAIVCCDWRGRSLLDVTDWNPIFEGGVIGGQWQVVLDE